MRQSSIVVALSAVSVAVAQTQNFTINPADVELTLRTQWCNAEFDTCGILCGQAYDKNTCSPADLKFECTCSNGTAPGLEYYIQTMPTFICQRAFEVCNEKKAGDSIGQNNCKTDIKNKCGTLDPSKADIKSPTDASSSSAAPKSSPTGGSGTSNNAPATTTSAGAGPTLVAQIGNGIAAVAVGVFAAALL